MYIVAYTLNPTGSWQPTTRRERDFWTAHETLEEARRHYRMLVRMDNLYTASICTVIESTDYVTET